MPLPGGTWRGRSTLHGATASVTKLATTTTCPTAIRLSVVAVLLLEAAVVAAAGGTADGAQLIEAAAAAAAAAATVLEVCGNLRLVLGETIINTMPASLASALGVSPLKVKEETYVTT